ILILPQRQTALVAKQAAAVDVLSGGRLRFGIGVGWNDVEYEALGADFRTRGARVEEQIKVLRTLWTQPSVTFHGRWHHIPDAGTTPRRVRRPCPWWRGGETDVARRRPARPAEGWISSGGVQAPADRAAGPSREEQVGRLRGHLAKAGRDPATFGIEGRI